MASKFATTTIGLHFILSLITCTWAGCNNLKSYEGYSVLRLRPELETQLEELTKFHGNHGDGIEFWIEPNGVNRSVDIMASPEAKEEVDQLAKAFHIKTEVLQSDLSHAISQSRRCHPAQLRTHSSRGSRNIKLTPDSGWFDRYQSYEDIELAIMGLKQKPNVTVETIGQSHEGRNIYLVKVSSMPASNRPVILIDAGHHAREWISHSTGLFILGSLLDSNQFDDTLKSKLKNYDFWFVPVLNPDGYKYSMEKDRMWRKTRSNANNQVCDGVDLNRNYAFNWRRDDRAKCREDYPGGEAFSEKEAKALGNLLDRNGHRITMYVTLHSYGQMILYPWGDRWEPAPNKGDLVSIAKAGARAIQEFSGTRYTTGTSIELLYPAHGCSDDHAYGSANIPFVFTIELPDKGRRAFILPPSYIIPVGKETVVGLNAMIDTMTKLRKRDSNSKPKF